MTSCGHRVVRTVFSRFGIVRSMEEIVRGIPEETPGQTSFRSIKKYLIENDCWIEEYDWHQSPERVLQAIQSGAVGITAIWETKGLHWVTIVESGRGLLRLEGAHNGPFFRNSLFSEMIATPVWVVWRKP